MEGGELLSGSYIYPPIQQDTNSSNNPETNGVEMTWNADLTGPALEIAETDARRLRVMAGPGTGKSYALQRRVTRLLEQGQDPARIWAVTFTRNAAASLSKDLANLNVPGCERLRVSTLHAYCFALLRSEGVYTGRALRTVMTLSPYGSFRFEGSMLVSDLINEEPKFGNEWECSDRVRWFEAGWAKMDWDMPGWPLDEKNQLFEQRLDAWLDFHKAMLIAELVPETLRFLRNGQASGALEAFDHVIVDEYQDLNRAEQEIVNLVSRNGSLAIVGDADQSIYGFRHAHPEGIKNFRERHQGTQDVLLVECRRNPIRVVKIANSLIAKNHPPDTPPHLLPMPNKPSGEVHIVSWDTVDEEARGIARYVKQLTDNCNYMPGDILVIIPRKKLGHRIRDAIGELRVPVHSFDQEALTDDAAQRAFTLLALLNNGEDRVALRWWLGRGAEDGRVGPYRKLREHCEANDKSPRAVLEEMERGETDLPDALPLLGPFRKMLVEIDRLTTMGSRDMVDYLLPEDDSGCSALREIAERALDGGADAGSLYKRVVDGVIQPKSPNDDHVRIMTAHKSKGLTSKVVIVASCCDGLVPFRDRRLGEDEQAAKMAENRRLFYVAITRCTKVLVLSSFATMTLNEYRDMHIPYDRYDEDKKRLYTKPSPFIGELGPAAPEVIDGDVWRAI